MTYAIYDDIKGWLHDNDPLTPILLTYEQREWLRGQMEGEPKPLSLALRSEVGVPVLVIDDWSRTTPVCRNWRSWPWLPKKVVERSPHWVDPYYGRHQLIIKAWLDDELFNDGAYHALVLPTPGENIWDFDGKTDMLTRRRKDVTLHKGKLLAAPYVGEPFFYWWWVAEDDQGRTVCGRQKREPMP